MTTGSLDDAASLPPTKNYGTEGRVLWIDLLMPGRLPDTTTADNNAGKRVIVSYQHPDHDAPDA